MQNKFQIEIEVKECQFQKHVIEKCIESVQKHHNQNGKWNQVPVPKVSRKITMIHHHQLPMW